MITRRGWLGGAAGLAAALPLRGWAAGASAIHVIRHFDTTEGERDPDLTETGRRRAEALVRWFDGRPLAAIHATPLKRSQQTIAPLAAARRLTPTLYGPAPTPDALAGFRAAAGPILIVGHSNTVPEIVAALGGERPAPLSHPDFGDIWTIHGGRTERARIEP